MSHLFIINPQAASGTNNVDRLKKNIDRVMEENGGEYEIYITEGPMDAAEKVKREAIKGRELRIYACGGDGTLSECVHGAAGYRNAAVTHYPCGTGNDFIKTFGDDEKLYSDFMALVKGDVHPVDIIDVNGRKCINICSVGIDARVGVDVHKYSSLPVIGHKFAYITSLVVNLFKGINSEFTIEIEDKKATGKFAFICACNGRYYGHGFNPIKTAVPDDGIIDFLITPKVSLFEVAKLLKLYASGEYYKVPERIAHVRGQKIKISSDKEFVVQADGEALYTKSAVMKIIPGGINYIYPEGAKNIHGAPSDAHSEEADETGVFEKVR